MSYETKNLVTRFKSSGLTQKEFCEKNSVALSTLQYHLTKLREQIRRPKASIPGFIPISMTQPSGSVSSIVLVRGNYTPIQIAEMIKEALN